MGVTTLTPSTEVTEAELWAETAENMGYEDLYAWVNDAESPSEEQNQSSLEIYTVPA